MLAGLKCKRSSQGGNIAFNGSFFIKSHDSEGLNHSICLMLPLL